MCLIFFALNNHPNYKLIVAANRDEFYDRKTAPADYWKDYPEILGGRDLEAGGTWMAMTKSGRISMLTNYRDPQNINPNAPSRGHLVSDYLERRDSPEKYMKEIEGKAKEYNGFNLLAGNAEELWYLSNYKEGVDKLKSGFYGLSNHLLDTPWPKVIRGKEKLDHPFGRRNIEPEEIFIHMYDEQRATDNQLPDTGIGMERESALSSMFIKTNNYGTRCTTVILIDRYDDVLFAERVYDLKTFEYTTKAFEFKIESTHEQR